MPRKKTPKQLDREIASSLAARGQPQLASLFQDPRFAKEMRHELQTRRAAQVTAAARAARPYTVKHLEPHGDRRVRALWGSYATEPEARAQADARDGWVEYQGRVIYGVAKESDPA